MDWIEGAENLQLRCFDRCALISASHTNSDIFETAICFLLIRACERGPKPLWRELVRTQFLGSVITGHFEPFTVWSSQLTGMESSVPSWVLTKVFCVMLYSVMHFCVLHSAWCLFDMVALSVLLPFTMALSFDTVYIFGFDLPPSTFRPIDLFTAFSTFDMDQ